MLKRTLSITALLLLFVSCNQKQTSKITSEDMETIAVENVLAGKLPKLELDKVEHDFGNINEGDVVETEFIVKNIGESDLVISDATASCGCTVPNYPKEPIAPGESAPIKVSFNSAGKTGQQNKTVTLTTNTETGKETFNIKANVAPKSK